MFAPVSHQKARISFDLHGCVTWMSMPRTALEPLDRSSQPTRLVVLDDPRLQVDLVDHRSLAGCSMHSLGSGQRVAARARWRGRASRRTSAIRLCGSEQATMCALNALDEISWFFSSDYGSAMWRTPSPTCHSTPMCGSPSCSASSVRTARTHCSATCTSRRTSGLSRDFLSVKRRNFLDAFYPPTSRAQAHEC